MTMHGDGREATARREAFIDVAYRDEVVAGLTASPRTLPPKLFYDARGARLFEQICELEEYYLTRAELSILGGCASELAARIGPDAALVEYGSGAGLKVRLLLDAMQSPAAYVPIDIANEQLHEVARNLSGCYPRLRIRPVAADFTAPLVLPEIPRVARRVAFFPGSTIGNFHPVEAAAFLRRVRRTVGSNGAMVIGLDRRKRVKRLLAAYDDRAGVTAAFNLNILTRLNRELAADFDVSSFRHRAVWNDEASRIEMHLESSRAQHICVGGVALSLARGETIWTECSYKYDRERLEELVTLAGFRVARLWTDDGNDFWVAYLEVRD